MQKNYAKIIAYWDNIFDEEEIGIPTNSKIGIDKLDQAMDWLCEDANSIIDFGCGNGRLCFFAAMRGVKRLLGLDLSERAINKALRSSMLLLEQGIHFKRGGVYELQMVESQSFDGAILSNIIDNLYLDDAEKVLSEIARILKPSRKVFLKVNSWLTPEEIKVNGIKVLEGDMLDDGLLLLNKTTEEWKNIFGRYFVIENYEEVYYPKFDQTNRIFYLKKK